MLEDPSKCLLCYEGKYCATAGITEPTGDCDLGSFCEVGETVPNPAGKVSTAPLHCPRGSGAPISCPTGFYQDKNAQGFCHSCKKGQFCYGGTQFACIAGYYCP